MSETRPCCSSWWRCDRAKTVLCTSGALMYSYFVPQNTLTQSQPSPLCQSSHVANATIAPLIYNCLNLYCRCVCVCVCTYVCACVSMSKPVTIQNSRQSCRMVLVSRLPCFTAIPACVCVCACVVHLPQSTVLFHVLTPTSAPGMRTPLSSACTFFRVEPRVPVASAC